MSSSSDHHDGRDDVDDGPVADVIDLARERARRAHPALGRRAPIARS
jgi:hypothetical protein